MNDRKNIKIDIDISYHRKRRRKKIRKVKIIKRINVALCAALFALTAIGMIFFKRARISNIENRSLAKWPEFSFSDLFSGKYASGIEEFYNDTVPGRDKFKNITATIRSYFGSRSEDAKIHGVPVKQDTISETKPSEESTIAKESTSSTSTEIVKLEIPENIKNKENESTDQDVEGEISNNILVYKNRGIMLFGGSYSNGERYAEYVSNFKADLGINVYSMVCPTPVSYYLPEKYKDLSASEKDNIKHINENLNGVTAVDAYNALMNHRNEDIFKRTDHHWAQLGAYYAAEEFARQAKVPFAKLSSYRRVEKDGYVGTLYGYSGDSDLYNNPENFVYYEPSNKYTTTFFDTDMTNEREGSLLIDLEYVDPVSWYLVFIGTDSIVTHVHTDVGNGRKLAIVKDSYGNALVPCLTGSFEDIFVVDMRYFEVNAVEQFKAWGITDLLFAMNTFSATGSNFECIEQIRTQ